MLLRLLSKNKRSTPRFSKKRGVFIGKKGGPEYSGPPFFYG